MSKKWRSVVIIAFVVGTVSTIVGFVLPRLDSFPGNFLAGIAVSAFAFAIAVLLIEGPVLTREQRLRNVIAIASHSVAQLNEEIAITLVREIGECLATKLRPETELHGDKRGNWSAFKVPLRSVFQDARQVSVEGLPKSVPLTEEEYLQYVEAARSFMKRVRAAIGSDREVQARLLELLAYWNRLDAQIEEAGYQYSIVDEKARYVRLAALGDALIDIVEACPKVEQ